MGTHPIFESDFDCLTEWPLFHPGIVFCVTARSVLALFMAATLSHSSRKFAPLNERKKSRSPRHTLQRHTWMPQLCPLNNKRTVISLALNCQRRQQWAHITRP